MATTTCSTITITETSASGAKISCFVGEENNAGKVRPAILQANILSEPMEINGVKGKEGELIITSVDDKNYGRLDDNGNLIIVTEDDDAKNYSISNLDLTYNG